MPATLPPSTLIVPNPPFVNAGRQAWAIYEEAFSRQPDPWPYVYFDNSTGAQPYAPGAFFTPGVTYVPFNQGWLSTVLQGWQPQWPYVFFDSTTGAQPYVGPTPTPPPTVVVASQGPYANLWMASVIQSWFVDPPRPILQPQLAPGIPGQSVDNPPVGARQFNPPYPGDLVLPQRGSLFPQTAVVVSTQGPYANQWMASVIESWFVPDPAPTLPGKVNPANLIVPNPPFGVSPSPVWGFSPGYVPVPYSGFTPSGPPPPVQVIYNNLWISGILQQWQPPDPPPTLPRNLSPSQLVVPNPPTVQPTQLPGIIAYWQPPDPSPTQPRALLVQPFIPPPVNNPPFTGRTELPGILSQWAAWPPSLWPTPYGPPPQVQPGPPPPPPPVGQFTVSGPDVSVYLQEFFYDVVYTDAPITKRTV